MSIAGVLVGVEVFEESEERVKEAGSLMKLRGKNDIFLMEFCACA